MQVVRRAQQLIDERCLGVLGSIAAAIMLLPVDLQLNGGGRVDNGAVSGIAPVEVGGKLLALVAVVVEPPGGVGPAIQRAERWHQLLFDGAGKEHLWCCAKSDAKWCSCGVAL